MQSNVTPRRQLAPRRDIDEPHARGGELLAPPGDTVFRAFKLDVLRVDGAEIAEITTFGYAMFPALGLPSNLSSA